MNEVTIPPSANWYCSSILKCAPGNIIIYGSRNKLVIIKPSNGDGYEVFVTQAGSGRINTVAINLNWGNPNKYAATACEEGVVQLWDIDKYELLHSHSVHAESSKKIVAVSIAGERVISVASNGHIVVWHIGTHAKRKLQDIFSQKVVVTCMSTCPHLSWLTAFGLESGLVVIADLRGPGKIMCKLRRHNKAITDLSWCPTPYSIFEEEEKIKTEIRCTKYKETDNFKKECKENNKEDHCDENIIKNNNSVIENSKKIDFNGSSIVDGHYVHSENEMILGETTSKNVDKTADSSPQIQVNSNELVNETNTSFEDIKGVNIDAHNSNNEVPNIILENTNSDAQIKDVSMSLEAKTLDDTERKIYLLASACKKGMICIWNGGGDGILQAFMYSNMKSKNYNSNQHKRDCWISLCWAKPKLLLSASEGNQLISWDLKSRSRNMGLKPIQQSFQYKILHYEHKRYIFSIAVEMKLCPTLDNSENEDESLSIWTVSQDRWIYCTSSNGDIINSYPTLTGYVNCVSVSPIDPNRLAIGVGDNTLRIWNLSVPHVNKISMSIFWDKSKIVSVDWHPVKENIVAFGTDEGRLAEIDVSNMSKAPTLYSNYHHNIIFKVQWGPMGSKSDAWGLYSCSNGELIVHDPTNPAKVANKISIDDYRVANFSWKQDFTQLAVGTKEGSVKILSRDLVIVQTLYMQKKCVQCLVWHPQCTASDSGKSQLCNFLAVATTEHDVYVYDCTEQKTDTSDNIVTILKGHNCTVKSLSWCPHISGRLVSASEDGTAQVWDVQKQIILATFHENSIPLVCIQWSPLDADLIITASKDNILKIWRVTKNPPIEKKEIQKIKKKTIKIDKAEIEANSTAESIPAANIKNKLNVLPYTSRLQNNSTHLNLQTCWKLLKNLDLKNNDSSIEDSNASDSDSNDSSDVQMNDDSTLDSLKIFGTRKDIMALLDHEQSQHVNKNNWSSVHHISLWKGNLAKSIRECMAVGMVDAKTVSLAPMVSHQLWLEVCEMYAEKLLENENGLEASSYFLVCHKVDKAIDALCKCKLFREAMALAQVRLSPEDPSITDILEKWASYTIYCGHYEVAAQCLIKLGKLSEASELLNKRSELECLQLAAELSRRCENSELLLNIKTKIDLLQNKTIPVEEKTESNCLNICSSRFEAMMRKGPINFENSFKLNNESSD